MSNVRFYPPKCRDKVQKLGVSYTQPLKMPCLPILKLPRNTKKNSKLKARAATGGSNSQFVRL
jgi:hypothetical protein